MRAKTIGTSFFVLPENSESPILQGEILGDGTPELHRMGDSPVVVNKMFGPLIFFPLRITAETATCEWVVERMSGEDDEWHEVARIPGQLDSDFGEEAA